MSEAKKGDVVKIIGLMSGTSLDGVDAAVLDTDGEAVAVAGSALTLAYDAPTRALLCAALEAAPKGVAKTIRDAERRLTDIHAEVVRALLKQIGLTPTDIAYLGFHGQTILHRPGERRTWQIGDGAALARATGIAVVNDFRSNDVAAGGEGAPFVPLYHAALVANLDGPRPVAVLNVGGVANVTYVGPDGSLLAFDTGPGNAPLDDWALRHTSKPMDEGGALAREGGVHEDLVAAMLENAYFAKTPPKSLDRLDFGFAAAEHLSPPDGAATLTAFTAASVARAREHLPEEPRRWIVCGGGRHNPVLMEELQKRLNADVVVAESVGWRGDVLEAQAFAYLAVRSVKGLPLSLPSTTGVPRPMPGGTLYKIS